MNARRHARFHRLAFVLVLLSFRAFGVTCPEVRANLDQNLKIVRIAGSRAGTYMRTNRGWENLWSRVFSAVQGGGSYSYSGGPIYGGPERVTFQETPRRPEFSRFLDAANLKGKRILDAGTGDGQFVTDLRGAGIDAVGLDIALNEAQKKHPWFLEADIRKTSLPPGSFDIITTAYAVFHYPESPEFYRETLAELARVLKPSGILVLIDANSGLKQVAESTEFEILYPAPEFWRPNNNVIFLRRK